MTRIVRIFLSSPSDVTAEQEVVVSLANEINDVVAFLAPELDLRLEVLRFQKEVYPDLGRPQDVIDRQIPQDFDIHLGIMWMRCGTPTATERSGTIHEFRQAMKRREATGRPIIMFYFSDERPPALPRTLEELDQLREVLKFREELQRVGLTVAYPDRASFRERVRGGLLRAIADTIRRAPAASAETLPPTPPPVEVAIKMIELARMYDEVRTQMSAGTARTRRMTDIFGEMVAEAPTAAKALETLKASHSAGERLAAIAILKAFPQVEQLDWLAQRLDPELEKPFVGYQAALALAQAVTSLPGQAVSKLEKALETALALAQRNPDDPPRILVLEHAQRELKRRLPK